MECRGGPGGGGAGRALLGGTMLKLLAAEGSLRHAEGRCKLCAFFHRPDGCSEGVACRFCHLCGAGEKKRRFRDRVEKIRSRKLGRKAVARGRG